MPKELWLFVTPYTRGERIDLLAQDGTVCGFLQSEEEIVYALF